MISCIDFHIKGTGGKTRTRLNSRQTVRQFGASYRTLGHTLGAFLCAVTITLAGCSAPAPRVPDAPALIGDTTNPDTSRQMETAKRAQGAAANAQADAIREDRAVAGFEQTARLFNWAGSLLAIASAGLFLASFFLPPTIVPRKLAFGAAVMSVGMLAASYFLVRYGVATAWLLLAAFGVQAAVLAWPMLDGWFRRKLEAKGVSIAANALAAGDRETRLQGIAIVEAANPKAKRENVYRVLKEAGKEPEQEAADATP